MSKRPEPVPLTHNEGCFCKEKVEDLIKYHGYHKIMVWLAYHIRESQRRKLAKRKITNHEQVLSHSGLFPAIDSKWKK